MKKAWRYLVSIIGAACVASAFLPGCGGDEEIGEGTLGVEIWGEAFIEEGIPSEEFEDGWSVTFDKFLVNIGAVSVAMGANQPALTISGFQVFDLAAANGPIVLSTATAPAGTYDHTAYSLAKTTDTSTAANATAEDLSFMKDKGYSVYTVGSATNGMHTVSFAWGFDAEVVYDPCHSTAKLDDAGAVNVQLTLHGDHLFYDDAVSESPVLRFEDIALADANEDAEVTPAELAAYDITVLPNYGVGSLDIDNLWDFIEHMTTTLGHIDGEGHCEF